MSSTNVSSTNAFFTDETRKESNIERLKREKLLRQRKARISQRDEARELGDFNFFKRKSRPGGLGGIEIRNLRHDLGVWPRVGLLPELPPLKGRLNSFERRRNDYLEFHHNLDVERITAGKADYKRRVEAACIIQRNARNYIQKLSLAKVVLEFQRKEKEKAEAIRRKQEAEKRSLEAKHLLEKIELVSSKPLKDVLMKIDSSDSPYTFKLENGWGDTDHVKEKRDILAALLVFIGIRELSLKRCIMKKNDDAQMLAKALLLHENIETLSLDGCGLEAEQTSIILASLKGKQVKRLALKNNFIARGSWIGMDDVGRPQYSFSKAGILLVADLVKSIPTLSQVELGNNRMGEKAFTTFVSSGSFSSPRRTLIFLDLSFNDIGNKGAYALAHVIACCSSLKTLNIAGNNLNQSGLVVLEQALSLHRSLKSLDLSQNNLGDRGAFIIAQIIRCNVSLCNLFSRSNGFSNIGMNEVSLAISRLERGTGKYNKLDLSSNRLPSEESKRNDCIDNLASMLGGKNSPEEVILQDINLLDPYKVIPGDRHLMFANSLDRLIHGLRWNNTLKVLDLRSNHIKNPLTPPACAFAFLNNVLDSRKGLRISQERQLVISSIFAPLLRREGVSHDSIAEIVMRVLAYDAAQRQILL